MNFVTIAPFIIGVSLSVLGLGLFIFLLAYRRR